MQAIYLALAVFSVAFPASAAPFQWVHVKVVADGKKPSPADLAKINKCGVVLRLKAGMTNGEAAQAIDDAYQRFFKCLKQNAWQAEREEARSGR